MPAIRYFQQLSNGFAFDLYILSGSWLTREKCFEPLWLNEECKNGIQSGLEIDVTQENKTKKKIVSKVE